MADFIDLTNDCDSVCDLTLESLDSDSENEFDVKKYKPTDCESRDQNAEPASSDTSYDFELYI